MPQTSFRDYWDMVSKKARAKASKTLGFSWRILGVIISAIGGAIASYLQGGNMIANLIAGLIGVAAWLLILFVVFLWHWAHEPVLVHNSQETLIEEQQRTISNFEEELSNKKIVINDEGDSIRNKERTDIELRFAIYNDSRFPMENWYALVEELEYCKDGDSKPSPTTFPKNRYKLVWCGNTPTEHRTKPIPPHDYADIAIAETTVAFNAFKLTTSETNTIRLQQHGYYLVTVKLGGTFNNKGVTKRIQMSLSYKGQVELEKIQSHIDLPEKL